MKELPRKERRIIKKLKLEDNVQEISQRGLYPVLIDLATSGRINHEQFIQYSPELPFYLTPWEKVKKFIFGFY